MRHLKKYLFGIVVLAVVTALLLGGGALYHAYQLWTRPDISELRWLCAEQASDREPLLMAAGLQYGFVPLRYLEGSDTDRYRLAMYGKEILLGADDYTEVLQPYLGKLYFADAPHPNKPQTDTCNWYFPQGRNDLLYLICEANGELTLWSFPDSGLIVAEGGFYGRTSEEIHKLFPNADLPPNSYRSAIRLITAPRP